MKLRRDIAAVPLRSASATWSTIVDLITKSDSIDSDQLSAAATVMATLLTEEHYAIHPLTLKGSGHRLVVYCAYGANALTLGEEVAPLDWNPTAEDWTLYVPCDDDNFDWVKDTLAKRAPRLTLHRLTESISDADEATGTTSAAAFEIDWSAAQ